MCIEISVIIPAYNAKKYIMRTIDSILRQTFEDFEVIIIDDVSTDGTFDYVISNYQTEKRVRIFQHINNSGQGVARNTGLKHAKGKYIFFLDSDDWIEDDTLNKLYTVAEKESADIVSCGLRVVYEDGKIAPSYSTKFDVTGIVPALEKLLEGKSAAMACWNKLYKKELLERNNIQFPPIYFEDLVFAVKAICACERFISIPDELCNYYQSAVSTTRGCITEKHIDSLIKMTKLMEQFIRSINANRVVIPKLMVDKLFETISFETNYYMKKFYLHNSRIERDKILNSVFFEHMGDGYIFAKTMIGTLVEENEKLIDERRNLLSILKNFSRKKIIFFGTGNASQIMKNSLPFNVHYYIDNNPQKWGQSLGGETIYSPEQLRFEEKDNLAVIIASQFVEEISEQLEQMGFEKEKHFWNGMQYFYYLD